MQKILFIAHCLLNTASKVVLYNQQEIDAEEKLRRTFLNHAVNNDIQLIQLPCPEFTIYGSRRWGHVSNQFDNVFFRSHCRNLLKPIIAQLKEYLANEDRFEIIGFIGVDGSPSCGVDYTCYADWYGAFDGRSDLNNTLADCRLEKGSGVFIAVLTEMLAEEQLEDKIIIRSLFAAEPEKCLDLLKSHFSNA